MKRLLLLLVILSLYALPAQSTEKVILSTLEWQPYIGQTMKNNGYVAAVVNEAFKRNGIDVELQFHQWTRTVGLAMAGEVDGYFPEYYAENIEEYANFSVPFPGGPLVFFKLKDNDVTFNSLQDLKGLKIGVVKGYTNSKEFDEADFLLKDPAKDDLTNFKKLAAGRIDLLLVDKFVGLQILKEQLPDKVGEIVFMEKSLEEKDLYVCISKKAANGDALLKAFNEGLNQMKADGTISKIMAEHGF